MSQRTLTQLKRALIVGLLLEAVLFCLMLAFGEIISKKLPWLSMLQYPAAAFISWLLRYPGVRAFLAGFPATGVVRVAQFLGFMIQTAIFAVAAWVLMVGYERYRRRPPQGTALTPLHSGR